MKKGDIFWATSVPIVNKSGKFFYKSRPVIILSASSNFGVAQVVPLSAKIDTNILNPNRIIVGATENNLEMPSVAMVEHICTISQTAFLNFLGTLDGDTMKIIEESVKVQLELAD